MVLIITNKNMRDFHIYFSFKFCKRLCVSFLEVFPTLIIKIERFFQNKHLHENTQYTYDVHESWS